MFEQWHHVGLHPRNHPVTGQPIGAAHPRPVGRDDAESEIAGIPVRRFGIVSTRQAAMTVQHCHAIRVTVNGVTDGATAREGQHVIADSPRHETSLSRRYTDRRALESVHE